MSEARAYGSAECRMAVPGGMLVIAPRMSFGRGAGAVVLGLNVVERLQRIPGNPEAIARLRADWHGLQLPGDPGRLSPPEMQALLEAALASHRLMAAFFPRPVDPLDRIGVDAIPRAVIPAAVPASVPAVRDMSRTERVEAALKRVPNHLTGALKDAFLGLISPTSIAITVGAFAALAVAQFFGYGEVADAVLAGIAYGIAGLSGVRALYDMVAATVDAATATNDAEIEAAATRLADAFVVLGIAFLTIFITRAARKAAQSRAASSAEPAPQEPQAQNRPRARTSRAGGRAADDPPVPVASEPVYRVDGRPPGTIFNEGFQPRGTSTDLKTYVDTNSPSAFVGTSKTPAIADNPDFAKPGSYLYEVDSAQVQGIDVNKAYPANPFAHESEIAVVGGVPPQAIISAKPILPGGGLGNTIPNPFYKSGP